MYRRLPSNRPYQITTHPLFWSKVRWPWGSRNTLCAIRRFSMCHVHCDIRYVKDSDALSVIYYALYEGFLWTMCCVPHKGLLGVRSLAWLERIDSWYLRFGLEYSNLQKHIHTELRKNSYWYPKWWAMTSQTTDFHSITPSANEPEFNCSKLFLWLFPWSTDQDSFWCSPAQRVFPTWWSSQRWSGRTSDLKAIVLVADSLDVLIQASDIGNSNGG